MRRRPRRQESVEDTITPNSPLDSRTGTGKDPQFSGPREDESKDAPLGHDPSNLREENPKHRADSPTDADPRPWKATSTGVHKGT